MKEIYAWVDWFGALCKKIANEEKAFLIERAKKIPWGDEEQNRNLESKINLFRYGEEFIDPFSFIYFLSSKNLGDSTRKRVFHAITHEFDLEVEDIPITDNDFWLFPRAPNQNTVFGSAAF